MGTLKWGQGRLHRQPWHQTAACFHAAPSSQSTWLCLRSFTLGTEKKWVICLRGKGSRSHTCSQSPTDHAGRGIPTAERCFAASPAYPPAVCHSHADGEPQLLGPGAVRVVGSRGCKFKQVGRERGKEHVAVSAALSQRKRKKKHQHYQIPKPRRSTMRHWKSSTQLR